MKPITYLVFALSLLLSNSLWAHIGADASHASEDAYWADLAQHYPAFIQPPQHRYAQRSDHVKKLGRWGEVISWPHVPVSAANLPDGRIITWSASQKRSFPRGTEFTYVSTWHPLTKRFIEANNTYQDMFAAHLSLLEDGRLFVNGGNNHIKTSSVFDFKHNTWTRLEDMHRGRWYPTNVTLPSGEVFSALGSSGGRYPEIWNETTGWKVLTGIDLTAPILQYDDYYEREWWPLLHVAPLGYVFHSGPTPLMHNISTKNLGSILQVGVENRAWYPKHGTTLMIDKGMLLVAGGAVSGTNKHSTNKAMLIDINSNIPKITPIEPMIHPRKFHNGVILPTGEVLVVGGNTSGIKFADKGSVLPVEIWNPQTKTWREGAEISVPRNYHSIALLLPDGRVLSAGGGLCNCLADHQDAQVYSPSYLFNDEGALAKRPTLSMASDTIKNGQTFTLQSDADIATFSLIKMSTTTHGVNSDLRYLAPKFSALGNGQYQLTAHANRNILTSGYWMFFAINQNGVPSVAKIVQVTAKDTVSIEQPNAQAHRLGSDIALPITVNHAVKGGVFSATNLPQGLVIHTQTGLLSGQPQTAGIYRSKIKYQSNGEHSEILLMWNIYTRGNVAGVSYEVYTGRWQSLPDIENLAKTTEVSAQGAITNFTSPTEITQPFFVARLSANIRIETADSYQFFLTSVNGSRLFIDGQLILDNDGLHTLQMVSNGLYLEQGTHTIRLEYFVTTDAPKLSLHYANSKLAKQPINAELLTQYPSGNVAPVIVPISSQTISQGHFTSLNVLANDANGDPLVFSATGLPNGLSINSKTGVISGIPSTIATYNATIKVSDTKGKTSDTPLSWQIRGQLTARKIIKSPKPINRLITYPTGSNGGEDIEYQWDFGDGSAATPYAKTNTGSHTFATAGSYTVTLSAKDAQGNEATSQFVQAVYNPHTKAKPSVSTAIVYTHHLGAGQVWNVNSDSDSISGFNASSYSKLTELAVGKKPSALAFAPDGTLWVTNKDAYSISVVDTSQQKIIHTIALPYASQPHGLVFSKTAQMAYVVLEASGTLVKIDATTRRIVSSLNIGTNPRHISLNATENLLYVSRYITPPLPDEATASPQTDAKGILRGGEVLVVDTTDFKINNTIILQHNSRIDAEDSARGIPNYLGAVAISPDGLSAWVPSKQDNIKRGKRRDGQDLTFDSAVRSISSKLNLTTGKEHHSARFDHDNGGIASAALYGRYGNYLFVALEGSREIEVLDAYSHESLVRLKTDKAPQGLALSEDGLTLFSHNFMARSITVYDLFNLVYARSSDIPLLARLKPVSKEPLTPTVLRGKQLFYDSFDQRLAKEHYSSCASCHNEGRGDGRVWDMTGFGEGLRNTISLQGHGGMDQGMLHWSGNFDEVQDFEGQIRALSGGTGLMRNIDFHSKTRHLPLGTTKSGVSQPLDDLANYVASLKQVPASPYRSSVGKLSASAQIGETLFTTKGCIACHKGKQFTDSAPNVRHDIGTIKATTGKRLNTTLDGLDTPTLLGVWQTAPYLHDGSAKTLEDAIRAHSKITALANNKITRDEITHLINYLKQLDNESKQERVTQPTVITPQTQGGGAVFIHWLLLLYGMLIFITKMGSALKGSGIVSR